MAAAAAGSLAGAVALVTGATSGIGAAVARRFAGEGAALVLVARRPELLAALAGEVGGRGFPADVADAAAVDRLAAFSGRVDVVVHAAGSFGLSTVPETAIESFDRMLAVNVRAAFLLMRAFVPAMRERRSGHFVSIGSVAGRRVLPGNGAYAASKFALRGLHGVLAAELSGTGVRATLVEPAATDTPLWDSIDFAATPGLPTRSAMLRPDAVADAVLYAVTRPPGAAVHNIILDRN